MQKKLMEIPVYGPFPVIPVDGNSFRPTELVGHVVVLTNGCDVLFDLETKTSPHSEPSGWHTRVVNMPASGILEAIKSNLSFIKGFLLEYGYSLDDEAFENLACFVDFAGATRV